MYFGAVMRSGSRLQPTTTSKTLIMIQVSVHFHLYLGGGADDSATSIAVDASGNAYVTGSTSSTDFPTSSPPQSANRGKSDIFVAKLNVAGNALVYSTYLGGSEDDFANGVGVDAAGSAYITGETASGDFPTRNPIQATNAGSEDSFVTKLDPTGSALVYSTFLGGSGNDFGTSIALDPAGNAYVAGATRSTNFPVVSPLQTSNRGNDDAFVAKLNAAGSALVYSTFWAAESSILPTLSLWMRREMPMRQAVPRPKIFPPRPEHLIVPAVLGVAGSTMSSLTLG